MNFQFGEGDLDSADVRQLLDFHFAEMRASSPPDAYHVLPVDSLRDPAVTLWSVRDEAGLLLGVGALKQLSASHGEVKSMRTAPAALGLGVGRALLGRLIAEARAMGPTRLSLETGNSRLFDAANRLYSGHGFERCGPFGDYRATDFTHFYTRAI